jgi:hypothetical protein
MSPEGIRFKIKIEETTFGIKKLQTRAKPLARVGLIATPKETE